LISKADRWIESPVKSQGAECRLFCLSYAGGSSTIFTPWQRALPNFVEVLPIQLPGRGSRMGEKPFTDLSRTARAIHDDLLPLFKEKPFAFFGHSMGATISFEVARILTAEDGILPFSLFVSGRQAPHVPDRYKPLYNLPHDEFIQELRRLNGTPKEVFEHQELLELVVPILRADFEAIDTYKYVPSAPLECPILALGGEDDVDIHREDLEAWQQHTARDFRYKIFPGDHFYLHTQLPALLRELIQEIRRRKPVEARVQ
jgi:medium-chain acyl-[acyl-carrier-protein] hydrolase